MPMAGGGKLLLDFGCVASADEMSGGTGERRGQERGRNTARACLAAVGDSP